MKKVYYELYRNNNRKSSAFGRVFARSRHLGIKDVGGVIERMECRPLDAVEMGVVVRMTLRAAARLLAEGWKVKLDDLCILSLAVESEGAACEHEFQPLKHITSTHLNVQATGDMRRELTGGMICTPVAVREKSLQCGGVDV